MQDVVEEEEEVIVLLGRTFVSADVTMEGTDVLEGMEVWRETLGSAVLEVTNDIG